MTGRLLPLLAALCLAPAAGVVAEAATSNPTISEVNPRRFKLGDKLVFKVDSLETLCPSRDADEKLRLFLDGRPLLGIPAITNAEGKDQVAFKLEPAWARSTDKPEENVWAGLVSGSLFVDRLRKVQASVGYEACPAGEAAQTSGTELELIVITEGWQWAWLLSFLAIAAVTIWLGRSTALLRQGGATAPYSLARTQMAYWTVLAMGAFLLILMSTGFVASLPGSVLALLGISAATGLGSAVVDGGKQTTMKKEGELRDQMTDLDGEVAAKAPASEVLQRKNEIKLQLAQMPAYKKQESHGFWRDLLDDGGGTSIYRLQFVLWTVVLGGYFVYAVATRLIMPPFSEQLLLLMGISSGTYVTVKTQEEVV